MRACPVCRTTYADTVAFCPDHGVTLSLLPGCVIRQRFRVDQLLGRGGFGEVYRVWHLFLNEPRALKMLLRTRSEAPLEAGALTAEARVLRQLQHPNIVRVEDADETEQGRPFVVMEYVPGESLRDVFKREGALPVRKAVSIGMQICGALRAAHEKGILHRDIKPENILVVTAADGSPAVKMIDFGIAKVIEDSTVAISGLLTVPTGFFLGSPLYCSPEQAQGMRGGDLDARGDLYSLGVVLFEALTGALPFRTETAEQAIGARLSQKPFTLEQARPDLKFPGRLQAAVMRALQRDRNLRFRSAEEMETELRQVWTAITAPPPAQTAKRKPFVLVALVTALIVTAVCLAMVYLRRDLGSGLSAEVRDPWSGVPPGVYVTQAVQSGQRMTSDLLKEIGPASQSNGEGPKTLDELGAQKNCLVFERKLQSRERIIWSDVGTCP